MVLFTGIGGIAFRLFPPDTPPVVHEFVCAFHEEDGVYSSGSFICGGIGGGAKGGGTPE